MEKLMYLHRERLRRVEGEMVGEGGKEVMSEWNEGGGI